MINGPVLEEGDPPRPVAPPALRLPSAPSAASPSAASPPTSPPLLIELEQNTGEAQQLVAKVSNQLGHQRATEHLTNFTFAPGLELLKTSGHSLTIKTIFEGGLEPYAAATDREEEDEEEDDRWSPTTVLDGSWLAPSFHSAQWLGNIHCNCIFIPQFNIFFTQYRFFLLCDCGGRQKSSVMCL
jgi:hypothetical protein